MELEEFIKTTLVNIKKGITNANKELNGGVTFIVNPGKDNNISFDIAVTTTSEISGGGKIRVAVVSLGGEKNQSEEYISRIKFVVNLHSSIH